MGYISDSLDFEKFFAKDLWSGIKKDPKRLVLGVDPASTWAWNKVLGRDDDPLVDQMGGPYDGRVFSFGHGNGGVYDRAQDAGINTKSASMNHDAAHLIAGAYGAAGIGGAFGLGGGGSGGANPGLWDQGFAGTQGFSGAPYGSNPAAGISGIGGPVGGGTGASSAASMGAMDYAKLGMGVMNAASPQQQQQQPMAAPPPQRSRGQQVAQSINGGLGRASSALFPVDPTVEAQNPAYAAQLRNNAMLQLGLGMAAAARQPGGTFAGAFGAGLGRASTDLNGAMQTAYQNARAARADQRADNREDREFAREERLDARQQWLEDHTLEREKTQDARWQAEQDYRMEQAGLAQKRWESEQAAQAQWRSDQIAAREAGTVPAGYRKGADGNLEAIPGGPADPSGLAARKGAQSLRKEFRGLQSVKDYETTLPLVESVRTAPDTPQGDLQMIYTVGKVLDPGSVVREGELELTQNAAPWLSKVVGQARAQLGQGGRLTPEMRKGLIDMLDQRVGGLKQAYERDRKQYAEYATEGSISPDLVVGTHPMSAYGTRTPTGGGLGQPGASPAPVQVQTPEDAMKLPPGTVFITPDGRRKVR